MDHLVILLCTWSESMKDGDYNFFDQKIREVGVNLLCHIQVLIQQLLKLGLVHCILWTLDDWIPGVNDNIPICPTLEVSEDLEGSVKMALSWACQKLCQR